MKKKYLIALPSFPNAKGFNHRTILVSATDKADAISLARYLHPNDNIGDIKEVSYQAKHQLKPVKPAWEPKAGDWVLVTRPENWQACKNPDKD